MLIQLAYKAPLSETCPSEDALPQVYLVLRPATPRARANPAQIIVIIFTDEYARVVQGARVPPLLASDPVEQRISVSANLRLVERDTNGVIPGVWKQLLGWTFCRAVEVKQEGGSKGGDTTGAAKEGNGSPRCFQSQGALGG